MKPSHRFLLILFVSLALIVVLSPLVKVGTDAMVTHWPWMAKRLRFSDGHYHYGRVSRRMLMVIVLGLLVAYRKQLHVSTLMGRAFQRRPGWPKVLALGFGVGVLTLALLFGVSTALGAWQLEANQRSWGAGAALLAKFLISAAVVGLVEEALFRGFLLQAFMQGISVTAAVILSSVIYSITHFLRGSLTVRVGFDGLIGLKALEAFFEPLASALTPGGLAEPVAASFVGLFLTGVVLAQAYLRTGALYLPIGLHAGLVFTLKAQSLWWTAAPDAPRWLHGGNYTSAGVLSWVFLLLLWAGIHLATRSQVQPQEPAPNR